jgi:hypothetical protein
MTQTIDTHKYTIGSLLAGMNVGLSFSPLFSVHIAGRNRRSVSFGTIYSASRPHTTLRPRLLHISTVR